MFKSGFLLVSPEQIAAAIFNKSDVIVWQSGRILDYGGPIESQTEHSVTINGAKYLKENCEFRIR
ncbi:hypothetical protein [Paenibacillus tyrfis]|uniref:Uncharacterized protein n=1 Tax=Paenibacillus tyrfis TaxID=1501230 RepID=A0A081NV52_9BACL|nr:hypothetical protein [Paenibacillus tyrfis]KEQ22325.1 hypothetical protein ET33_26520 [Paenibacillus tyrfis]